MTSLHPRVSKAETVDPIRSAIMRAVRQKNTTPELKVRQALHRMGYRFRLHRADLPGRPDIVLPKYQTVIFVHGCFWHRHPDCSKATMPKTRRDFWQLKFDRNTRRDARNIAELEAMGWKVIVIWECEATDRDDLIQRLRNVAELMEQPAIMK